MDVTPPLPETLHVIDGYGDGGFRIKGVRHEGALAVWPYHAPQVWEKQADTPYDAADFAMMLEHPATQETEILVIGNGKAFAPFPPALRALFRERGIAVELMDTGAACRTYNILISEGRPVAALLLPV